MTAGSLDALFRKAKKRAMIDDGTFHDTRHLAITRLAKKLNVLDLARMVGTKTFGSFRFTTTKQPR
jgi:integrase